MRLHLLFICIVFSIRSSFAQQEKMNTLYLKTDNVPDRIVLVRPVPNNCLLDDDDVVHLDFEGKLSEKNVRLIMTFKNNTRKSAKIKTDADGDPYSDQKVDIEIFGDNPAVDKTIYAIENEKDKATIVVTTYNESTGDMEGTMTVRYWDSSLDKRKLSAEIRFSVRLK